MVCSGLTISRARDMELVKRLWTDPRIYSQMADDGCPKDPADWQPNNSDRHFFLIPWLKKPDNEQLIPMGMVAYYALSFAMAEVHIGILPEHQHQMTKQIGLASLDWIFANTPFHKVVAFIPITRPKALKIARQCGFKEEGYLKASFMSDRTLIDQYLMGMGRSDHVGIIQRQR